MNVVPAHPEAVHQRPPGRREPTLGADRGLGRAGGTGGEVEEEPVGGGGPGGVGLGAGVGGEEVGVGLGVRHQDAYSGEFEAVEEREVGPFGDQHPALGVQDVADQFGAPPGGVDTGDGRAREGRRAQPEGEFRGVVEEDAEVRVGPRRQEVGEQGRAGGGPGGDLVVGQDLFLEPQPGPVVALTIRSGPWRPDRVV